MLTTIAPNASASASAARLHMLTTLAPHIDLSAVPHGFQPGTWRMPTLEEAVLLMAISANCILIFAPLRSALRAAREELGVKELMGLLTPTYMLFGQSYFWACYGATTGQPDISRFNAFGAGICMLYLAFMTRGAQPRQKTQAYIALSVALVVGASLLVYFLAMNQTRVFAYAAMLFSMLQSLAPMYQAVDVLRTMSPVGFPFAVTASSCVSSLLWAQYAIMVHDRLYFLSNAINTGMGAVELAAVGWAAYSAKALGRFDGDHQPLMPRAGKKRDLLSYGGHWSKLPDAGAGGEARFGGFTTYGKPRRLEEPAKARDKLGNSAFLWPLGGQPRAEEPHSYAEELSTKRSDGSFRGLPDCLL